MEGGIAVARRIYLCVGEILADLTGRVFALLGAQHLPKQEEPVQEEAAVRERHGYIRFRKIIRALLIHLVLGIGIHGVVAKTIPDQITVLVATAGRAVLVDLHLRVGCENSARAIVHVVAEEILVDVCVQQSAVVAVVVLGLSRSAMGVMRRNPCTSTHHGHRGADRATDRPDVGHGNVIHGSGRYRGEKAAWNKRRGKGEVGSVAGCRDV